MHSPMRRGFAIVAGLLAAATVRADVSVSPNAGGPSGQGARCATIVRAMSASNETSTVHAGDEVIWGQRPHFEFVFGTPNEKLHDWEPEHDDYMERPLTIRTTPHAYAEMEYDEPPALRAALDRCFDLAERRGTSPRPTK